VALDALVRIERDNAYANLALSAQLRGSGLDQRDRALVTELVYGTIRQRRACDFLVDRFLSSPPNETARAALRLGAYQLHFTDIPPHAAVSTTVAAVGKGLRGLINAVLRKVASQPVNWPDEPTRLSYPDWIVERLTDDLGSERATDALMAMNAAPVVTTRDDGYTQDVASQRVAEAVGVGAGGVVADVCAAPGGKATHLAGQGARVVAADIRPKRVGLVAANVAQLGLGSSVLVVTSDGLHPALRPHSFDAVLVDAPCSGLGVLGRRADARWRITPDDVSNLAVLQRDLLDAAVDLVRPGGTLVYSVCTLTAAESIGHDAWMAERHPDLTALEPPAAPWAPWGSGAILLPQELPSDGMVLMRWRVPPV
jgi:16S rRNA (cytosine967-C5)-methyltransferase